jgi:hypothetical protein
MTERERENGLDVLACDIETRPQGAPGIDDIAPALRNVARAPDVLTVSFDPSSAHDVEAFVKAERQCCSTLDWQVERAPDAIVVRVSASQEQLDVLQQLFAR